LTSDFSLHTSDFVSSHDIITIGMRADEVRRRLHGATTTFVRVVDAGLDGEFVVPPGAGEIRILATPSDRAAAVARVSAVLSRARGVPVSAYSLADLEQLAARQGVTLRSILEELRAAGLELVAEAPFDRLQDARRSIEEVNIAGLALARLTIHQLSGEDMSALFRRVVDLQRAVAVIRTFAPLPRRINPAVPTTGFDDVKRVAIARLLVDNVGSIQVDWALYGPKLAQVALTVGADDVDSVSAEGDTGEGPRRAPLEEIRRNIRAAGLTPVERNGRFEPVSPPRSAEASRS
jgi:aminodeoxyfutalosine synthase